MLVLLLLIWGLQGSKHVQRKLKERLRAHKKLESTLADQFTTGRLYACISRYVSVGGGTVLGGL